MYCIEGEITTRNNPETLIGNHGLFYTDDLYGTQRTFISTGQLDFVEASRQRLTVLRGISPDAAIELIGDRETAEKYTSSQEEEVGLETEFEPDAIQVIEARIPSESELLLAEIALWREFRKPRSKRYTFAHGILLGLLNFDADQGWHRPHDFVAGTREITGKVTPRKHSVKIVTHTEARDAIAGSSRYSTKISDVDTQCDGDRPRFLNITRDIKKSRQDRRTAARE